MEARMPHINSKLYLDEKVNHFLFTLYLQPRGRGRGAAPRGTYLGE